MPQIIRAETDEQFTTAGSLFEEYAASLGVSLCFQNFDEELKTLAQQYGAPDGCLLLAYEAAQAIGCVALRKLDTATGEMKRLYVKPQFRHLKIGKLLVASIIEEARQRSYRAMRLDTLPSMTTAQRLYAAFGFREIPSYTHNPIAGTVFMELQLSDSNITFSAR